jgi:anti-sigma B factor antagonist
MRGMVTPGFTVAGRAGSANSVRILTVTGAITSLTSPAFHEAVKAATAACLIVDLTGVPSVDSMALGTLVQAYVSCHKAGQKLRLVGLTHRVKNILELTGVAPLFETYATVDEAENALR